MILGTNTLSAVAEGEPSVVDEIRGAERIVVPIIVLGEYRLGVAHSRYRRAYESCLGECIESVTVLDVRKPAKHMRLSA